MTAELDPIGLSNSFLNCVIPNWDTDLLTVDLFDPGLPTFHDAALFQDVDELFQHFFPPTCEDFPTFFGGMLLDVPPVQAVGRNAFLSPPVTPGITMDPQTATAPNNGATRDCDHDYGRATEPELVVAGDVHPPVAIPTTSLSSSPHPSAATFPANWIKIPQRSYDYGRKQFDFKRLDPISFSTKDHPGINLGDALRKNCTRLNGKSDPMVQAASRVASCRLLFPGYPDNGKCCQIHTLNWTKTRTPISRKKLAHEVAKKVDRYLTRMARITPDGSVEDRWRIGQGFMHIDNMYLVSLISVSKGSFQPEIYVEVPSAPRTRTDVEGRDQATDSA